MGVIDTRSGGFWHPGRVKSSNMESTIRQVGQAMSRFGLNVEVRSGIESSRPDILVTEGDKKYAIEFAVTNEPLHFDSVARTESLVGSLEDEYRNVPVEGVIVTNRKVEGAVQDILEDSETVRAISVPKDVSRSVDGMATALTDTIRDSAS